MDQFEQLGLGDSDIAKAALEYEADRKYFALGQAGRLNHFAQHYGFANLDGLRAFVARLDAEAQAMGYLSYATICVPSRYMSHKVEKFKDQADKLPILAALRQKWDILQRESVFTIERFIACRIAGPHTPFFVDVNDEGVLIELRQGRFTGAGIVSSQFRSDKSEQFHREWFA